MRHILLAGFLALAAVLPLTATAQSVPYLAGGVGDAEIQAIKQRALEFNLRLVFADGPGGHYRTAVRVRVSDGQGRALLDVPDGGPLFYAKLPPGRYDIVAEADGRTQSRRVEIVAGQAVETSFFF